MNLNDLQTFLAVVDTGSFTAAAERLGVPKSTVSRRVARLEDALGVELLTRKPRAFAVSADGKQLHARLSPALEEVADAERALVGAGQKVAGLLRITAPHDFGTSQAFATLLSSFKEAFPDILPEVQLTMRAVDLIEEGFDVAFRMHATGQLPSLPGIMTRRAAVLSGAFFAGPSYVERHGAPREPADLLEHRCLSFIPVGNRWSIQHVETSRAATVEVQPCLLANDLSLLTTLIVENAGIGFIPDFVAAPHLSAGTIVRVLPQWKAASGQASLLWPASRHLSPRVRAFLDHATTHLTHHFTPPPSPPRPKPSVRRPRR